MDIKGLVGTVARNYKKAAHYELSTDFTYTGLKEYPRPQMQRKSYINLNGQWDYQIVNGKGVRYAKGQIEVPFSPEARLSKTGITTCLQPSDTLTYFRNINIDEIPDGKRLILHFGAVDQIAHVYINDEKVFYHEGGYTAFCVDITDFINVGDNELKLVVRDYTDQMFYARGKQSLKASGMFYTAQSGIWQTVWMEWIPENHIENFRIDTDIDNDLATLTLQVTEIAGQVDIRFKEDVLADYRVTSLKENEIVVELYLKDYVCWSPENPQLYYFTLKYGEDEIETYLAMRLFSVEKDNKGMPRLCLNHVPTFFNGVLDQGYYPESLLTPPSDEAMIFDIQTMKDLGFNMLRKHCKIEPMRWYYHCDRIGMVVWQDIINGGTKYDMNMICTVPTVVKSWSRRSDEGDLQRFTGRADKRSHSTWTQECIETVNQLYNVPSLGEWTLFNEGWGQFNAAKNTKFFRTLDNSRPIDSASGWFHQKCGDIFSEHIYFQDLYIRDDTGYPYVISEYGGFGLKCNGHVYMDSLYGYKNYVNQAELQKEVQRTISDAKSFVPNGLCGAVITQLTDVEEEQNGLITYDRKVVKIKPLK